MLMLGHMSSDECMRRVQGWLIEGTAIGQDDPDGRRQHVFQTNARTLPLATAAELAEFAAAHWAAFAADHPVAGP
jgi:hypothetical protein